MNDLYVQKGAADPPPPAEATELPAPGAPIPRWVGGHVPGTLRPQNACSPCNGTDGGSVLGS